MGFARYIKCRWHATYGNDIDSSLGAQQAEVQPTVEQQHTLHEVDTSLDTRQPEVQPELAEGMPSPIVRKNKVNWIFLLFCTCTAKIYMKEAYAICAFRVFQILTK